MGGGREGGGRGTGCGVARRRDAVDVGGQAGDGGGGAGAGGRREARAGRQGRGSPAGLRGERKGRGHDPAPAHAHRRLPGGGAGPPENAMGRGRRGGQRGAAGAELDAWRAGGLPRVHELVHAGGAPGTGHGARRHRGRAGGGDRPAGHDGFARRHDARRVRGAGRGRPAGADARHVEGAAGGSRLRGGSVVYEPQAGGEQLGAGRVAGADVPHAARREGPAGHARWRFAC